jgi:hypothetical protein
MRRIVVSEFISLDGAIEDPGGAEGSAIGGWTFKFDDPEGMKYKLDEVNGHPRAGRRRHPGCGQRDAGPRAGRT